MRTVFYSLAAAPLLAACERSVYRVAGAQSFRVVALRSRERTDEQGRAG